MVATHATVAWRRVLTKHDPSRTRARSGLPCRSEEPSAQGSKREGDRRNSRSTTKPLPRLSLNADTRATLTTACRALDRVIRAGRYWVPQWYLASHRIAYWDVFSRPATKPRYARGAPELWWYDPAKAAKSEQSG